MPGDSSEAEFKWENRLWTVFQVAMISLVGYLTLQTISAQAVLREMVVEHRYTNIRLDKIETQLERGTDDRYRGSDARRDFDAVNRQFIEIDRRLRELEGRGSR